MIKNEIHAVNRDDAIDIACDVAVETFGNDVKFYSILRLKGLVPLNPNGMHDGYGSSKVVTIVAKEFEKEPDKAKTKILFSCYGRVIRWIKIQHPLQSDSGVIYIGGEEHDLTFIGNCLSRLKDNLEDDGINAFISVVENPYDFYARSSFASPSARQHALVTHNINVSIIHPMKKQNFYRQIRINIRAFDENDLEHCIIALKYLYHEWLSGKLEDHLQDRIRSRLHEQYASWLNDRPDNAVPVMPAYFDFEVEKLRSKLYSNNWIFTVLWSHIGHDGGETSDHVKAEIFVPAMVQNYADNQIQISMEYLMRKFERSILSGEIVGQLGIRVCDIALGIALGEPNYARDMLAVLNGTKHSNFNHHHGRLTMRGSLAEAEIKDQCIILRHSLPVSTCNQLAGTPLASVFEGYARPTKIKKVKSSGDNATIEMGKSWIPEAEAKALLESYLASVN